MRTTTKFLTIAALMLSAGAAADAQTLTTSRLLTGLTRPVFVTAPPGDTSRLFIVEQRGSGGVGSQAYIRILNLATNTLNATPFLTVTGLAQDSEQGLLSMAFAPDYATSGRFYVYYVSSAQATVVARYTVSANPNIANPTGSTVLTFSRPFTNHNGGWIGFGPDGYLYISSGDGGSQNDPNGNGQNLTVFLGKLLRIDVSGAGTYTIPPSNPFAGSPTNKQEIWAYGLRNPWRPSFDRATGDLWIADVGQDNWEEINFQPAAVNPPFVAKNYGWRCYEANLAWQSTTGGPSSVSCSTVTNFTFPIHAYSHSLGCSISGGYVYRGCAIPSLRGTYFFADYCSNQIWSFRYNGVAVSEFTTRTTELARAGQTINGIVSFGEDANGEMYICDQTGGELYKIIPRCKANCDGVGGLTANDFQCFLNFFVAADCTADCDGVGGLTANDFQCFLNTYVAGCS